MCLGLSSVCFGWLGTLPSSFNTRAWQGLGLGLALGWAGLGLGLAGCCLVLLRVVFGLLFLCFGLALVWFGFVWGWLLVWFGLALVWFGLVSVCFGSSSYFFWRQPEQGIARKVCHVHPRTWQTSPPSDSFARCKKYGAAETRRRRCQYKFLEICKNVLHVYIYIYICFNYIYTQKNYGEYFGHYRTYWLEVLPSCINNNNNDNTKYSKFVSIIDAPSLNK